VRRVMTDSGKHAYYAPGLLGTQVVFGGRGDCVRSAIAGRVVKVESLWEA
jgi:predicted aconitase